jgi:hypothetical protein
MVGHSMLRVTPLVLVKGEAADLEVVELLRIDPDDLARLPLQL